MYFRSCLIITYRINIYTEQTLYSVSLIKGTQVEPKSFFNVIFHAQTTAFYIYLFILFVDGKCCNYGSLDGLHNTITQYVGWHAVWNANESEYD